MRLERHSVPGWPRLAWVATFRKGAEDVLVLHGPMVETAENWCVEAVWAGDFAEGDFDRSDLVFGSGVRIRGDCMVFVSSATGVDRLWYCDHGGSWFVSNSLPALLAVAKLSLLDDYSGYNADIESVERKGIRRYTRSIPTDSAPVNIVYFDNLIYDGQTLRPAEKPDAAPNFHGFDEYRSFLVDTARALRANLESASRTHRIIPLVGVSSGYDSPATSVIAREAGCRQAVSIVNSTSLWRGSDSGEGIARRLGLSCRTYRNTPSAYRCEESIWAATGRPGGLNLTIFDYPGPLCLFFNGSYGDRVWDRRYHDLSEPVGDTDSLLCEFRLIKGVFQTVVPWWGIRHAQEVNALGSRPEMEPWMTNTKYDRPVARRIIEEAGIPRGTFAVRKKMASSNRAFWWPMTPEGRERFARYLRVRGIRAPSAIALGLARGICCLEVLIASNLFLRIGSDLGLRRRIGAKARGLLFQWGNYELKQVYEKGLASAPPDLPGCHGGIPDHG